MVTTPEVAAVRDADRIVGLIEAEEKGPPQLIVNRVRPAMVEQGEMLSVEDVVDILALPLLGVIPEDPKIIVSTNKGEPIVLDGQAPAGQALRNVARRLEGEEVPFLPLEEERGILGRLRSLVGRRRG